MLNFRGSEIMTAILSAEYRVSIRVNSQTLAAMPPLYQSQTVNQNEMHEYQRPLNTLYRYSGANKEKQLSHICI